MKKKLVIAGGVVALLIVLGVAANRFWVENTKPIAKQEEISQDTDLPTVDPSVSVNLTKSTSAANTVILSVKGLGGKMSTMAYELTYESQGLIRGMQSDEKKPLDVSGKENFERDFYLGTCSSGTCKPHLGVKEVSVLLIFTDTQGKKSQFTRDFPLD